jgi:hypothetical protein
MLASANFIHSIQGIFQHLVPCLRPSELSFHLGEQRSLSFKAWYQFCNGALLDVAHQVLIFATSSTSKLFTRTSLLLRFALVDCAGKVTIIWHPLAARFTLHSCVGALLIPMFVPVILANLDDLSTATVNVCIMPALFRNEVLSFGQLVACRKGRAFEALFPALLRGVIFNMPSC